MSPYADLTLSGATMETKREADPLFTPEAFPARVAAAADVQVTLDITAGVPHVFQAAYPILDEAAAALDRAGQLLSAHLASLGGRSPAPTTAPPPRA
jgi:monoterpene epsilon-lactone hydrolase